MKGFSTHTHTPPAAPPPPARPAPFPLLPGTAASTPAATTRRRTAGGVSCARVRRRGLGGEVHYSRTLTHQQQQRQRRSVNDFCIFFFIPLSNLILGSHSPKAMQTRNVSSFVNCILPPDIFMKRRKQMLKSLCKRRCAKLRSIFCVDCEMYFNGLKPVSCEYKVSKR